MHITQHNNADTNDGYTTCGGTGAREARERLTAPRRKNVGGRDAMRDMCGDEAVVRWCDAAIS